MTNASVGRVAVLTVLATRLQWREAISSARAATTALQCRVRQRLYLRQAFSGCKDLYSLWRVVALCAFDLEGSGIFDEASGVLKENDFVTMSL